MNGIYIHIPYCKSKCHYCDFYSVIRPPDQRDFAGLIVQEMQQRSQYLEDKRIDTIYVGGGTPSLISAEYIQWILDSIGAEFDIQADAEITLEANPDDIDAGWASQFKKTGVNRLSLGIQALYDEHLKLMNRRHTARQALDVVALLKDHGFDAISIDLIYGIPGLTEDQWMSTLKQAVQLPANHISAYHLTFEPGTRFSTWKKKGILREIPDEESLNQYRLLRKVLVSNGFRHYEISNFARNGEVSRHNSKYWKNVPYLGLGPSAHSFNGKERNWNPSNLRLWAEGVRSGNRPEGEILDTLMQRNEFVMTRLRTDEGIDLREFRELFGLGELNRLMDAAQPIIAKEDLISENERIRFNPDSWFRSDSLLADLFNV